MCVVSSSAMSRKSIVVDPSIEHDDRDNDNDDNDENNNNNGNTTPGLHQGIPVYLYECDYIAHSLTHSLSFSSS